MSTVRWGHRSREAQAKQVPVERGMEESQLSFDADVLIVGYGMTSKMLALQLVQAGHSVIILERHNRPYSLPRAVTFDDETARNLASIGLDSDNDPRIEYFDAWYQIKNGQHKIIAAYDWSGETTAGWHRWYWFNQPELESIFHNKLLAQKIDLRLGYEAIDLIEDADGATLTCRECNSEDNSGSLILRGRFLVGADGANSFVRENRGLRLHDLGFQFDWLIVDVIPNAPMTFDPPIFQLCDPRRPTTVVPGGPGRRRWEFMMLPGETVDELNRAETAWALLEPWGVTPQNAILERHVVWQFQAKWAENWSRGRSFIVGDAAHLMPPFAGQGMCAGLRDAVNLGWKLDFVLRGLTDTNMLESYSSERNAHVQDFIALSIKIGGAVCVADEKVAAARDSAMIAEMQKAGNIPEPPYCPSMGPGIWLRDQPGTGRLAGQGYVRSGTEEGRFDEVVGTGWMMVGYEKNAESFLSADELAGFKAIGGRIVRVDHRGSQGSIVDRDGFYERWFENSACEFIVIRPDFYLAAATTGAALSHDLNLLFAKLHLRSAHKRRLSENFAAEFRSV